MKWLQQKIFRLSFLIIVAKFPISGVSAQVEIDPFAESAPESNVSQLPPEPDHLVPLDPYPGDWHARYTDFLVAKLKSEEPYFARMDIRPSFEGESSLRLHGEVGELDPITAMTFFLSYSIAEKSIWYSMPENNEEKKQKEIKVTTTTVPIPKAVALRIHALWERMILRTRYPTTGGAGLDGVTIEFSTRRGYGRTWSPMKRQSPLLFVELGQTLINYSKATSEEKNARLKEVEKKADDLEKYINVHHP